MFSYTEGREKPDASPVTSGPDKPTRALILAAKI